MTPFCLFDSPSIRTGGIGGPPDIALKPTVQTFLACAWCCLCSYVDKARLCLASPKHSGFQGVSPLVRFVRRNALHRRAFYTNYSVFIWKFRSFFLSFARFKFYAYEYETKISCCCFVIGCYHFCLFDYDSGSEEQYKQHSGKFAGD